MSVVLVIDDDDDIRTILKTWLKKPDREVVVAEDGAEGLQKALSIRPSVIVCDLMMPELDGFELLRRLKQDRTTSGIPILMLSARDLEGEVIRALEAGAADYVVKPFSPRELVARVDRLESFPSRPSAEPLLRKVRLIEWFGRMARDLSVVHDVRQLSERVLAESLSATGAERGSFMIVSGEDLRILASRGLPDHIAAELRIPIGKGIAGTVAAIGSPLLVQDIDKEAYESANPERYPTGSLISVPISIGDRVVGVLNVNTKPENDLFSAEDLGALEFLADLAGLALSRLPIRPD